MGDNIVSESIDSDEYAENGKTRKYSQRSSVSDRKVVSDNTEEDLTCSQQWKAYPKHVLFIVGMEFCERFSYYGMRSVLLLYLRNYLHFDDDTATAVYHAFTVLAYFTPVLGAIVADSYWGKYKTIILLSIVYIFGHVVKVIGSIPFIPSQTVHVVLSMAGLIFIAFGTGGIKPCVSSFGGDQFSPDQTVVRKQFFSLFYFAINAGSLISTFVTPILRADVDCYPNQDGEEFEECYALAFGVPAALMVVALILFVAGSRWYIKRPPEGSIFWKFCHCIGSAIKQRWNTPRQERNKEHWLDYANSTPKMIRDTKYVIRVLVIFIPLPFFWALFDQQGSRWTLQAIELDGHLGSIHLKPDQIETLNPVFIVTLIPLFEVTLYPLLRYFKINFSPLRRMTLGLFLAGVAFIFAAILQIEIEKRITPVPGKGEYSLRVINSADCDLTINTDLETLPTFTVYSSNVSDTQTTFLDVESPITLTYKTCNLIGEQSIKIAGKELTVYDVIIRDNGATLLTVDTMIIDKSEDGGGKVSFVNTYDDTILLVSINEDDVVILPGKRSEEVDLDIGTNQFQVMNNETQELSEGEVYIEAGGIYTVVLDEDSTKNYLDINPNTLSVAWIFPQFFIITVGEVFLSVTGLEFSYTQAPPSMKSVLTSFWLLTVSFGNIIVLIIAETKAIESQANEFFLFAGLIGVAGIVFIILAYFYIPVDEDEFEEELKAEFFKFNTPPPPYVERSGSKRSLSIDNGYDNVTFSPEDGNNELTTAL